MVRPIKLAAALALCTAASAWAQIDLTPKDSFYEVEGVRAPNVAFRNGSKKITYTPPGNWKLSGGASKVSLTPMDGIQSGATIEVQTAKDPFPEATAENIKAYSDMAIGLVPREASKVEVTEAVVSSMRISGKAMIDVTLTYAFFGQTFRMNVLFMPRGNEQLRFQFIARAADYAPLFKSFRSSLFTMQGL